MMNVTIAVTDIDAADINVADIGVTDMGNDVSKHLANTDVTVTTAVLTLVVGGIAAEVAIIIGMNDDVESAGGKGFSGMSIIYQY